MTDMDSKITEPDCTWADCPDTAKHPQRSKEGEVWANLCNKHVVELDNAIEAGPPEILGAWVKAQGGLKAAAKRMTDIARPADRTTCKARADYRTPCIACGATPTVVLTKNGKDIDKLELCGPCCFGEAKCADPNEWVTS